MSTTNTKTADLPHDVLTQNEQRALTPDGVLASLKDGNARFAAGEVTLRNHTEQVRRAETGQFPEAVVLSCIDSRVPVESVFDRGIGDLFVARVAGNFVNTDILGSMEFACKVSGSKLILILGHQHCGAVKGAIDAVELGNITSMLANIRPAVGAVEHDGDRSSGNAEFVQRVAEENVRHNLARVRAESPILKEMEDAGEIKLAGAIYHLDSGRVSFLDE